MKAFFSVLGLGDFFHALRYGKFSFHWGKPRGQVGFYHCYYDGDHYTLNLYFLSIGLDG